MITVESFFKKLGDEKFYYHPNPGNAGDALIQLGIFHFFKKNNIDYTLFSERGFNSNNKNIIYSGGGNLGKMSNHSVRVLRKLHKTAKRVIILPHTIKEIDPLLKEMGSNVFIFCREARSLNYVKSCNSMVNVYLDHDMAFHTNIYTINSKNKTYLILKNIIIFILNKLRLTNYPTIGKDGLLNLVKYKLNVEKIICQASTNNTTVLNCFRTDGEKTDIEIPEKNFDLSEILSLGIYNEEICEYVISNLFSIINKFDLIRTNRLHIAVSCALLGKKVEFYPNNYFKCEAIYEYSLKGKYNCVIWKG